jgi:hypothetical protein
VVVPLALGTDIYAPDRLLAYILGHPLQGIRKIGDSVIPRNRHDRNVTHFIPGCLRCSTAPNRG